MKATELTPRLREIEVIISGENVLTLCSILASKSLKYLILGSLPSLGPKPSTGDLRRIFSRTPHLSELDIRVDLDFLESDFLEIIQKGTSKMNLERLSFHSRSYDGLLPAVLKALGSALPVTHLISLRASDPACPTKAGFGEGLFSSLTSLEIAASFSSMLTCLRGVPGLTKLLISSEWPEDVSTVDMLLGSISEYLPSLVSLKVHCHTLLAKIPLTFRMLSQHSVMRRLTNFELEWPAAFEGSNDHLISLVSHMPAVEELALEVTRDTGTSNLTLDVLAALSRQCPKLRKLTLNIDCRVQPSAELLANGRAKHSALRVLHLNQSPFNDDFQGIIFASWLSVLLPESCSIWHSNDSFWQVKRWLMKTQRRGGILRLY